MKLKKLKGHSGCNLFLCRENDHAFVRKISPNKEYNFRLREQCNKQMVWNSDISCVPAILASGYKDGLFYFDMEYVLGSTVSSLLTEDQIDVDEVIQFLLSHFKYQYAEKRESSDVKNAYSEKIKRFNILKIKYPFLRNLHQALELLSSDFWISRYTTKVHGDMTMENLVKSKKNNKIYMIDFLDDFSNGLYTDLSKIFQDILGGWSFLDKSKCVPVSGESNLSVRLIHMKKKLISGIILIDKNERMLESILYGLLVNYIRIIPYIQHDHVYSYIDNKLKETIGLILNEDPTSIFHNKNNIRMVR